MALAEILVIAAGAACALLGRLGARPLPPGDEEGLDDCPLPVWRTTSAGLVVSGNARFAAQGGVAWLSGLTAERVAGPGEPVAGRVFAQGAAGLEWHDIRVSTDAAGDVTSVAVPADREVRLEERLGRMTMLMTQSFAALPAGVALFDESGTLALFNPALSDLLGLDAAWLARRPDLRDLTDRLRSGRIRVGSDDILHWKRFQHLLESPGDGQSLTTVMPPSGGPGLKVTVKGLGGASRVLIFQEPGAEAARPGAAAPKASATA